MHDPAQPLRAVIARTFALSISLGTLAACGGGGGGDSTDPPPGDDGSVETLTDRIYALGAQLDDATGDLVVYAIGLREDGTPLTSEDFANNATITVGGAAAEPTDVSQVTDADGQIASLSFLTDYSHSMPDTGLQSVTEIYSRIVDSMPKVFNASALVFTTPLSATPGYPLPEYVKYTFDQNVGDGAALKGAFAFDPGIERKATPLNDAVSWGLFGTNAFDGLNDQCRPIRMLFAFADGEENGSNVWLGDPPVNRYNPSGLSLYERLDQHNVVRVMLGVAWTGDTEADPAKLESTLRNYAGEDGAFVLAYDNEAGVRTQATNLADALSKLTKITVPAGIGQTVNIEMDGKTASIDVDAYHNEMQACLAK